MRLGLPKKPKRGITVSIGMFFFRFDPRVSSTSTPSPADHCSQKNVPDLKGSTYGVSACERESVCFGFFDVNRLE